MTFSTLSTHYSLYEFIKEMRRWKITFRGFFRASHDTHCGETIIPQEDKALFSTVINISYQHHVLERSKFS